MSVPNEFRNLRSPSTQNWRDATRDASWTVQRDRRRFKRLGNTAVGVEWGFTKEGKNAMKRWTTKRHGAAGIALASFAALTRGA